MVIGTSRCFDACHITRFTRSAVGDGRWWQISTIRLINFDNAAMKVRTSSILLYYVLVVVRSTVLRDCCTNTWLAAARRLASTVLLVRSRKPRKPHSPKCRSIVIPCKIGTALSYGDYSTNTGTPASTMMLVSCQTQLNTAH